MLERAAPQSQLDTLLDGAWGQRQAALAAFPDQAAVWATYGADVGTYNTPSATPSRPRRRRRSKAWGSRTTSRSPTPLVTASTLVALGPLGIGNAADTKAGAMTHICHARCRSGRTSSPDGSRPASSAMP